MSVLLDAIAGVPSACEPLPGLVTGGQPAAHHFAALKAAGCEVVLDIRDHMEPRPMDDEEAAVRAAGLEYINIAVNEAALTHETLARVRDTVATLASDRKTLFHCNSGNRVGATLIPYLMLDRGFEEEDAIMLAMRIGARNADLIERALEYVKRQTGRR
ncbi:MAG: hypothetical protein ACREMV_12420 [Gemmatimonadales bacterium]